MEVEVQKLWTALIYSSQALNSLEELSMAQEELPFLSRLCQLSLHCTAQLANMFLKLVIHVCYAFEMNSNHHSYYLVTLSNFHPSLAFVVGKIHHLPLVIDD